MIKPLGDHDASGYLVGGLIDFLLRLDPFVIGFPLFIGQAGYNDNMYLALQPQVELELRLTSSFSISLIAGYLCLLNEGTFKGETALWQ